MNWNWIAFALGCAGGVIAEVARWYKLRESVDLPGYIKSPLYWIVTILMSASGGLLAVLYGVDVATSPLLALNVGISAPLIIGMLVSVVPTPPTPNVRNFIGKR